MAVLSDKGDPPEAVQGLLAMLDAKGAEAERIYPPIQTELRLYAGLLAAHGDDRVGVDDALRRTQDSSIIRDYPTVAQLQQVVLAEQERLAGKPQAAVARLAPLAKQDTALVSVHWALMRSAQASRDDAVATAQRQWLRTHRGRVFVESTTSDVLRFFNIAVSGEALRSEHAANRPVK
ncbi:MAG TPA: hypothetical protein VN205_03065 [Thermomonas sp.]|nr:hypothetical protein [Thermomonas sp.]